MVEGEREGGRERKRKGGREREREEESQNVSASGAQRSQISGVGVIVSCESPDVGAGQRTQVLCKSSKCS